MKRSTDTNLTAHSGNLPWPLLGKLMKYVAKWMPSVFAFGLGGVITAWAMAAAPGPSVEALLETDKTVLGQEFAYPSGQAKITAAIVTVPPGVTLQRHRHPVPLFGYILQGELTVDYGSAGTRTYRRGDSLVEAFQTPHQGSNGGKGVVEILVVYAGAVGVQNTVLEGS